MKIIRENEKPIGLEVVDLRMDTLKKFPFSNVLKFYTTDQAVEFAYFMYEENKSVFKKLQMSLDKSDMAQHKDNLLIVDRNNALDIPYVVEKIGMKKGVQSIWFTYEK